jgi:hypothetical protein
MMSNTHSPALFVCLFVSLLAFLSTYELFFKGWAENDRGVSYIFGADVIEDFLEKHDLDLIVRAHQVVEDGYQFFAGRRLVTLFSAPNYCGEFDNAGAMISIDEALMCSFQILKPSETKHRRYQHNHNRRSSSSGTSTSSSSSSRRNMGVGGSGGGESRGDDQPRLL